MSPAAGPETDTLGRRHGANWGRSSHVQGDRVPPPPTPLTSQRRPRRDGGGQRDGHGGSAGGSSGIPAVTAADAVREGRTDGRTERRNYSRKEGGGRRSRDLADEASRAGGAAATDVLLDGAAGATRLLRVWFRSASLELSQYRTGAPPLVPAAGCALRSVDCPLPQAALNPLHRPRPTARLSVCLSLRG